MGLCDTSSATDSGDRRQCGGRLKQHEEAPRDAIRPALCMSVVKTEDNVNVRDAAACKLDQVVKRQSSSSKIIQEK